MCEKKHSKTEGKMHIVHYIGEAERDSEQLAQNESKLAFCSDFEQRFSIFARLPTAWPLSYMVLLPMRTFSFFTHSLICLTHILKPFIFFLGPLRSPLSRHSELLLATMGQTGDEHSCSKTTNGNMCFNCVASVRNDQCTSSKGENKNFLVHFAAIAAAVKNVEQIVATT